MRDLWPSVRMGQIFVGNRIEDKVYAVKDVDGDGKADKKWTIASGLNMPNGVAFRNGDLYVAEVNRIHKFSKASKINWITPASRQLFMINTLQKRTTDGSTLHSVLMENCMFR